MITPLERLQNFGEIRVTSFSDVFALAESGMKGLAGMVRHIFQEEIAKQGTISEEDRERVYQMCQHKAEEKVHDVLCLVIVGIQNSFNVTNKMSEVQIEEAADIIREEFYFLTPADFQLFSNGAKSGKYGVSFNRLDAQVICTMLREYVNDRLERAQYNSKKEYKRLQEAEKLTPEQADEFKARFYKGADDLFQKIKENDEEPDEDERRYHEIKRQYYENNIPIAEKIEAKEKELEALKRQMIEEEENRVKQEEMDRLAREHFDSEQQPDIMEK